MAELKDTTCSQFTHLIASTAPAPGGGGAAALVGAVAVALGDMVGEFTVGKKKYADVEEDIKALMAEAETIRLRLLELIDEDATGFEPLAKAYAIPKDEPGRDEVMEECLRTAAAAPAEIFDLACRVIEMQYDFAKKGSRLMISDAATGASFARAAMEGAAVNVKVNTRLMKDRAYADKIDAHIADSLKKYSAMAEETIQYVWQQF
ncbi:MAG: cyclodeaminase/cyclohydrolase family protein [Lachnospiraceae bacterium]|nr:cyclodeaminase/cyclohydrolase family protein [Candidatus Minthocola equi]